MRTFTLAVFVLSSFLALNATKADMEANRSVALPSQITNSSDMANSYAPEPGNNQNVSVPKRVLQRIIKGGIVAGCSLIFFAFAGLSQGQNFNRRRLFFTIAVILFLVSLAIFALPLLDQELYTIEHLGFDPRAT